MVDASFKNSETAGRWAGDPSHRRQTLDKIISCKHLAGRSQSITSQLEGKVGGEVEDSSAYWLILAAFSRGLRERGPQAGGRHLAGLGMDGDGWGSCSAEGTTQCLQRKTWGE